jgi:hypothetical protein
MRIRILLCAFFALNDFTSAAPVEDLMVKETGRMPAVEAAQAAAADEQFVYAISSTAVAKYDRATGARLAVSTGEAKHLNSGFLWEGKLYCAHSNYPTKPEHSEIKVLDPASMVLSTFKDFGASDGSLTWVVRDGPFWWCTFAFYQADNARTRLVKFDEDWKQLAEWTYPAEVVKDLGKYSISGGVWRDGILFATGHDHRVIYRLRLPESGSVLQYVDKMRSPFPGQGIALDQKEGVIIGIDRSKKAVVFGEISPARR